MFEYGPCSTNEECYDATFPMAETVGDAIAGDCVAANTKAIGDMIQQVGDNPTATEINAEATSGDCKVVVHVTDATTMTGEVYDLG